MQTGRSNRADGSIAVKCYQCNVSARPLIVSEGILSVIARTLTLSLQTLEGRSQKLAEAGSNFDFACAQVCPNDVCLCEHCTLVW